MGIEGSSQPQIEVNNPFNVLQNKDNIETGGGDEISIVVETTEK